VPAANQDGYTLAKNFWRFERRGCGELGGWVVMMFAIRPA